MLPFSDLVMKILVQELTWTKSQNPTFGQHRPFRYRAYHHEAIIFIDELGQVVPMPVNINPGLKVKRDNNYIVTFPSIKMLSTAYVLCSLRLFMLKTEGQKI